MGNRSQLIDEAIDLPAAAYDLYQWQKTETWLKYPKKHRKVLEASERLDEFEWKYARSTSSAVAFLVCSDLRVIFVSVGH